MKRIRRIAGMLMLISSVTHVLQLLVYPLEHHVLGAAAFGIMYFFIGLFLLRRSLIALWLGAILPSIGGVLGVYRFLFLHPNPFTIFHVAIAIALLRNNVKIFGKLNKDKDDKNCHKKEVFSSITPPIISIYQMLTSFIFCQYYEPYCGTYLC